MQTVMGMMSGKDSAKVELKDLLAPFHNPFGSEPGSEPYHPDSRRLMKAFVESESCPEWLLSILSLDELFEEG